MPYRQFTIRQIMLVVVGCALVITFLRIDEGRFLVAILGITAGPIFGAVVERWRSGSGILGGVVGGVVSYVGFGIVMYLWAYLSPEGITTQLLGPGMAFFVLTSFGALVGLAVGLLIWGFMSIAGPWRKA